MTVVLPTPGRPKNSTEFGTAQHREIPLPLYEKFYAAPYTILALYKIPKDHNELERVLPSRMSRIMSTWPVTALPTRHVKPTIVPFLLRMALMRWRVPWTPALLSLPKSPTASFAAFKSSQVICTRHRVSAGTLTFDSAHTPLE